MPSSQEPENEFEFYLKFAKPLVLSLPAASQRVNAAAWIQKLRRESSGDEKLRTDYLKILLFVLQKRRLIAPFTKSPNQDEALEPFPEQYKLMSEMVKYLSQDQEIGDGAVQNLLPPCLVEYSHDLKEYAVSQEIPKFGIHAYFAISFKQTLQNWHGADNNFFPKGMVSSGEPHSLWNVPSSAIVTDSASIRTLSLAGKNSSKQWTSRTKTPKTSSPKQSVSSRKSSQMHDENNEQNEITGVTFSPSIETGAIPSLMSPKMKDPDAVSFEWMEGMSGTYVTDLRKKYGEQSYVKCKAEKEERERPTWGSNFINLSPLATAEASAAIVPPSTPTRPCSQLKVTSGTPKVTFKETKMSITPPTTCRKSKCKLPRSFDEAQDFIWMSQKFQPDDVDNIFDISAPFSNLTDTSTNSSRRSSTRSRDARFEQEDFEWLDDPSIAKYAGGPDTRFPDAERLPDEYWYGETRRCIPPFTARDGRGRRSFVKNWRQAVRRHDIPPTPPPFSRDSRIRSRARVYQPEEFGLDGMQEKEWQSGPKFFADKTVFFPGEDERLAKKRKRFSQIARSLDDELFDFDEGAPSFLDSSTVAPDFGAPSPQLSNMVISHRLPVSPIRYATDTLSSPVRRAIEYREKMRVKNAQNNMVSPPRMPALLDEEIPKELPSPIRPRREVKRYVEYSSPRALHSETNIKEEFPGEVKVDKSIIEDVYDTNESLQILDSSRLSAISEPFEMPDLPGPFDFQDNVQTPPKFKPFRYGEPTDIENLSFSSTKSYINDMTCPEFSSILSSSSSIDTLPQKMYSDTMLSPPPFIPFDYESPEISVTDRLVGDITPPKFEAFSYEESDEYIDNIEMPVEFSVTTTFDRRPDSPRPTDQTLRRRVRYQNKLSPIKDVISTPPRLGAQMQYFPKVPESAKLVKSDRIISDTHPTPEQFISPRLQPRGEMYTPSRGSVRRRVRRKLDLDQPNPDVSPTTKTGDVSRRRSVRVVRRINFDQPEPTPATPDVLSTTPPPIISSAMPWGNDPIAFGLPSPIKPLPRIPNRQFVSPLRSPKAQMRRTESKQVEKLADGRTIETSIKSTENISDESLGLLDQDDMSDIDIFSSTKRKIGEYTPPKYSPLDYESFEDISDDSLGIIESDFSDLSITSEKRIGEFTPPKFTPFTYDSSEQIADEISENVTPPSFTPFSYFGDEEEDDIFMTSLSPKRVPMFDRRLDSPRPTGETFRRIRYQNQLSPIKDIISTPPRLGEQMSYFPGIPESAKIVKSDRIISDTHPPPEQFISPRLQPRGERYTPSRGSVRRRVRRKLDLDQPNPDVSPTTKTGDVSRRRSVRVVRRINFDQPEPTPATPDVLSTTPPPIISSAMPWGNDPIAFGLPSPIKPLPRIPNRQFVSPLRSPKAHMRRTESKQVEKLADGRTIETSIKSTENISDESLGLLDQDDMSDIDIFSSTKRKIGEYTPPKYSPLDYESFEDISDDSLGIIESDFSDLSITSEKRIGEFTPPKFTPFTYDSSEQIADEISENVTPPSFTPFSYFGDEEEDDIFMTSLSPKRVPMFDRRLDSPRPTGETFRRIRYQNQLSPIKDIISTPPRLGEQMSYFPGIPESAKIVKSDRIISDTHPPPEQFISPRLQPRGERYTPSRGSVRRRVRRKLDLDQPNPDVSPTTKTGDVSRRRSVRVVRRINFDQPEPTPATPDVLSTTPPPIISSAMPWGNDPIAFGLPSPIKPLPRIPNRQFVSPLRSPKAQMRRTESKQVEKLADGRTIETSIKSTENISDESLGLLDQDDMSDIDIFSSTKRKIGEYTPPKYSPLDYESLGDISDDSLGIIESDFSDLSITSKKRIGEFTPPKFTPFTYDSSEQIADEISKNVTPPSFTPFSYIEKEDDIDDIFQTSMGSLTAPMFDRRADSPRPTGPTLRKRLHYEKVLSPIKDISVTTPSLRPHKPRLHGTPESANEILPDYFMPYKSPVIELYKTPPKLPPDPFSTPKRTPVKEFREVKKGRRIDFNIPEPKPTKRLPSPKIKRKVTYKTVTKPGTVERTVIKESTSRAIVADPLPSTSRASPRASALLDSLDAEPDSKEDLLTVSQIPPGLQTPLKPLPRPINFKKIELDLPRRTTAMKHDSQQIKVSPKRKKELSEKTAAEILYEISHGSSLGDFSLDLLEASELSEIGGDLGLINSTSLGSFEGYNETPPKYEPYSITEEFIENIQPPKFSSFESSDSLPVEYTPRHFSPHKHIRSPSSPPSFIPFDYEDPDERMFSLITSDDLERVPMLDRRTDSPRPAKLTVHRRSKYKPSLSPIHDSLRTPLKLSSSPLIPEETPKSARKIRSERIFQENVSLRKETPQRTPPSYRNLTPRAPKTQRRPRRLVKEIDEINFLEESPIKLLPPKETVYEDDNAVLYDIENIPPPMQFVSPLHSPRALRRKLKVDMERSDIKSSPEAAGLPLTTPKKSATPHRSSKLREPWARQYLATNMDRVPPRYTEYIPDIREESVPYISDVSDMSSDLLVGTPRFSFSHFQMSKESSQTPRKSASPRHSPKFKEPWAQQYMLTSVDRTPPLYTEYISNIDEESLPNISDVSMSSDRLAGSSRIPQQIVQRTEITYKAPSSSESLISENEYESRMRELDELLSRTELCERATPSPQFNIREPFEGQEDEYFLDTSPINTDWAEDERDFQWL